MTTSISKIFNNNQRDLFSDVDFILNNFMDPHGKYKFAESSGFPKLNLYSTETDDGKIKYVIEASITGFHKDDIDVVVDRNKLTISHNKMIEEKENSLWFCEVLYCPESVWPYDKRLSFFGEQIDIYTIYTFIIYLKIIGI